VPQISAIVCAHNPRPACLRRVLDSLKAQTLAQVHWELLVVDNASDNRLSDTYDLSWHGRARHVREDKLGLMPARLRGIAEARGKLLVFADDDNVLAPGFLQQALEIHDRHPDLGTFGAGYLEPEFEIQPPPEIRPRLNLLAIRTVAGARWSNNVKDADSIPWGAGLCVRRDVADAYEILIDAMGLDVTAVLGRRGQELFAGEDDIFSWVAASVGCGFGIFPELRLTHVIPAGRLNRRYLLKLIHDRAFSHGIRQYMLAGTGPRRIDAFTHVHLLLHGIRRGRFSMQCQWAASRGEDAAARFAVEKRLQPVELRDFVGVHRVRRQIESAAKLLVS
jgi:glycosyltransferase involved in cell wall biosynthesis